MKQTSTPRSPFTLLRGLGRSCRSWWKEERSHLPGPGAWRLATVSAVVLITPLLVLELQRRAGSIDRSQREDRQQAVELATSAFSGLRRTVFDWANWADMEGFVLGTNPGFLKRDVATTSLFDGGASMVVLTTAERPVLVYARRPLDGPETELLLSCARDGGRSRSQVGVAVRLICQDPRGRWLLGMKTAISNNDGSHGASGTLAMFQPLLQPEHGPALRGNLRELSGHFRFLPEGDEGQASRSSWQVLTPLVHAPGGLILVLSPLNLAPALALEVLEDLILIVAILAALLVVRAQLMLERRRQTLRQRIQERRESQRIRQVCQELDRLLDHFGLAEGPSAPDEQVLARLLGRLEEGQAPGAEPASVDGRLTQVAQRFQRFLAGAKNLALRDPLTQLPNRAYFMEKLELEAKRYQRLRSSFAILFVDVDKFKDINDTYGHAIGDAALVNVAQRLAGLIRGTDFLARYGGDEFVLLMDLSQGSGGKPMDPKVEAYLLAERITSAFSQSSEVNGLPLELSLSIGIALVDPDEQDTALAMQRSDLAMLKAKQSRSSQISIFEVEANDFRLDNFQLYSDLMEAVRNHELQVLFQPIVDGDGRVHSLEALARWHHPIKGPIPPEDFLSLAERHRKMRMVGEELLRLSLEGFLTIAERLGPRVRLSLNLSPSQLLDGEMVNRMSVLLRTLGFDPGRLTFEITELAILEANEVVHGNLKRLRAMGIHLSLDDFGTGYSSLNMLSTLKPQEVKIDKTFVMAMERDAYALQIIELIARMAPSMALELVAEGVEDRSSLVALKAMGIGLFQGYLFSRPIPADRVVAQYPVEPLS
ncbi:bifunctional diguanylate cyclase/phosphodiesterase [Cyanobium sp. Morenito 9A2]|uniref:putative bifunctional diguanylate cyclase/phosphodiesterase n=1 Tax=Cyanobium sp. Morenito 9A2 TaxID=2823718 RepID=UPI0020CDCC5C|nr:EAL domain-containing protein [Cyanobium sp. Morenito 9A2]MCP9848615.1 EAL domain-containing protein [Cyanobium sp. Morenito 9A2]